MSTGRAGAPEKLLPGSEVIEGALTTLECSLSNIEGGITVLRELIERCETLEPDFGESLAYLANRLDEHAEAAEAATGVLFEAVHGDPEAGGKEAA